MSPISKAKSIEAKSMKMKQVGFVRNPGKATATSRRNERGVASLSSSTADILKEAVSIGNNLLETVKQSSASENVKEPPASGSPTKKRRSWKKPADKPKRPPSAYNIFFQLERERLLAGEDERVYSEEEIKQIAEMQVQVKPKRKHRKTHGKIGFADLARMIASKWKTMEGEERALFDKRASFEKERYLRAVSEWEIKRNEKKIMPATTSSPSTLLSGSVSVSVSGSDDFLLGHLGNSKQAAAAAAAAVVNHHTMMMDVQKPMRMETAAGGSLNQMNTSATNTPEMMKKIFKGGVNQAMKMKNGMSMSMLYNSNPRGPLQHQQHFGNFNYNSAFEEMNMIQFGNNPMFQDNHGVLFSQDFDEMNFGAATADNQQFPNMVLNNNSKTRFDHIYNSADEVYDMAQMAFPGAQQRMPAIGKLMSQNNNNNNIISNSNVIRQPSNINGQARFVSADALAMNANQDGDDCDGFEPLCLRQPTMMEMSRYRQQQQQQQQQENQMDLYDAAHHQRTEFQFGAAAPEDYTPFDSDTATQGCNTGLHCIEEGDDDQRFSHPGFHLM